jgi:Putative metal-binding motif
MRRSVAWLAIATLAVLGVEAGPAHAGPAQTVKPYIVFILDVSGSMADSTGFGPPSCTDTDTKMDHAKCAIQKIANSYGDMVMALARFRVRPDNPGNPDTSCSNGCQWNAIDCSSCNTGSGNNCPAANGDEFEVLTPLLDNNQGAIIPWVDFVCSTCAPGSANPELYATGYTPIASSLVGDKLYWQGLDSPNEGPYWSGPGADPIRSDPLKDIPNPDGTQCRPYITILLTDGAETCTQFSNTTAAASSLLTTVVDGRTYRIETKPIGFGISPGDSQIEAIAHAGGAPDVNGVNEGLYAQNEDDVEIEVSRIIADSLKFETCNDLDDDCDQQIDEDFPDKGNACDDGQLGICKGTGHLVCDAQGTGLTCNIDNPGQPGTGETCNNLDDDCDGLIDEGACSTCGTVELCNGLDDDCDLLVDEDLTRDCGTDVGECVKGTETCDLGQWVGCTAIGPTGETCDGKDNDCDGTVDGFAETCSDLAGGNPDVGVCHPGTRVCPADGSGTWGPCLGEVGPSPEACNNADDDCDTTVDEDTGGADCSSSCGVGTTVCDNGQIVCQGSSGGSAEVCNNFDDDCDGTIDEDVPDGGPCDDGGTICNGVLKCQGGNFVCVGQPVHPESCNCLDDDCDGSTDEEPPALCPSGATCTSCQCAFPCAPGEFPCPAGKLCNPDNFCVNDPCFNVNCGPDGNGDKQVCQDGQCVNACSLQSCPTGTVCLGSTGECAPDDCRTFPDRCTADQLCIGGQCISDPCANVTCDGDQYCHDGDCVSSCAGVDCPKGQRCQLGVCEADPCGGPCPPGDVCYEQGMVCEPDPCTGRTCPAGQVCDSQTGACGDDPCVGVTCPGTGQFCKDGSCYEPGDFQPDAGMPEYVTTGGGGGCAAGGSGGGAGVLVLVVAAALRPGRRRRPRRRGPAGSRGGR